MTVLVVDDDPASRIVVSRILEREGFATVRAEDGVDALEQVRLFSRGEAVSEDGSAMPPLCAMVVDSHMPRMAGPELLRAMRSDLSIAHVPALGMSGDVSDSAPGGPFEQAGAAAVLCKPADRAAIFAGIIRCLEAGDRAVPESLRRRAQRHSDDS